jgi:uncharacterized protein
MAMRRLAALIVLLIGVSTTAPAFAQTFPELTGRVVDQAGVLGPTTENDLTKLLAAHESKSANQVVVVTVTSLEGHAIEEYGVRLGRHWGIGEGDRNNGILLIVAPNERKVRIEVGYGLEGALPDALAHRIIQDEILPEFRQNRMRDGIVQGTRAVLQAISGEYQPRDPPESGTGAGIADLTYNDMAYIAFFVVAIALVISFALWNEGQMGTGTYNPRRRRHRYDDDDSGFFSGRNHGSGGGFSGGGFSGGGGSFGGGGSSGSW